MNRTANRGSILQPFDQLTPEYPIEHMFDVIRSDELCWRAVDCVGVLSANLSERECQFPQTLPDNHIRPNPVGNKSWESELTNARSSNCSHFLRLRPTDMMARC
jgi:hypothetical protein